MVPGQQLPLVTLVTATGLEYAQARKALPAHVPVLRAGIALRTSSTRINGLAISCGLAGGLRADVPTGAVLIPRRVVRTDGSSVQCDEEGVECLLSAARTLGHTPIDAPLLTSRSFVHGKERAQLAQRGFAGVDMESGAIQADRLACVRVVLDTPVREISPAWLSGLRVVFTPRAWFDLPFLLRNGPRGAYTAAAIVAASLESASFRVRLATHADIPQAQALIALSARSLQLGDYTDEQIESAVKNVYGVDTALVEDGTYYVVESGGIGTATLVGCGGWGKRRALYGGDNWKDRPAGAAGSANGCRKDSRIFHSPSVCAPRHRDDVTRRLRERGPRARILALRSGRDVNRREALFSPRLRRPGRD